MVLLQSLDDVDFTVLAATSVLSDMIENCPPAKACMEAFDRMSKATIQMCMSTTGFGPGAVQATRIPPIPLGSTVDHPTRIPHQSHAAPTTAGSRQAFDTTSLGLPKFSSVPRFDMNLSDLFSEAETKMQATNRPSYGLNLLGEHSEQQRQQQEQQHDQRHIRRKATYQPPRLASTMSTSVSNLYNGPAQNFEHSKQEQARHEPQSFRPPLLPNTTTAELVTTHEDISHDPSNHQNVTGENTLFNNMDFFNDSTFNAMLGAGGDASFFDGSSRINGWNIEGQEWNDDFMGNVDTTGAQEHTGTGGGTGFDMFGGLFFG